jgi:hypothetical protein
VIKVLMRPTLCEQNETGGFSKPPSPPRADAAKMTDDLDVKEIVNLWAEAPQ